MPSNHSLELLPEAEDDLASIHRLSHVGWGPEQAEKYSTDLYDTIILLLSFPYRGKARPELFDRARSVVCQKHIIYYRVDEPVITVVRVLHTSLDVSRIFSEGTPEE